MLKKCLVLLMVLAMCGLTTAQQKYEPTHESLLKYSVPEWFMDVKLGIYFHWGVYSVPAYGNEWYPRWMFDKRSHYHKHHVKTYGSPDKFGYHDFVPMFKAENFDAEEWADLFVKAGARFAGPVAEHHDGFAMWDSDHTPWNAADMGPKRDLTGELEKAIRARGMKFITTFHHARNNLWQKNPGQWTGHYQFVKQNYPSVLEDEKQAFLYGYMPREEFVDLWKNKLFEVIDNYQPDIIWFDSWLDEIPAPVLREFLAYYYNRADQWNREVVVTRKQNDMPREYSVEDYEKGRLDHLTGYTWLTDDTISWGSWCYTPNLQIKSPETVIHTFVDIISKNGILLLNISPKVDGTIPEDQRHVLLEMGKWLHVNGEAVYDTRPWRAYGEGPTRMKKSGHFVGRLDYTPDDIRFTSSKDNKTLYAIVLGWPTKNLEFSSLLVKGKMASAAISLLGYSKPIAHKVVDGKLTLNMPMIDEDSRPCKYAFVFKLEGFDLDLAPDAGSKPITLKAENAILGGDGLQLETLTNEKSIGHWDDPSEEVHWLARIPEAGVYQVTGSFAAYNSTRMFLNIGEMESRFNVPATGGWANANTVKIGKFNFDKPGIYHVILKPVGAAQWSPVNLWGLELNRTE